MSSPLTYDDIYRAWKKEKESGNLQPLPKDFYGQLSQLINALRQERELTDEKTLRAKLLIKELDNIKRFARDLHKTRLEKVLSAIQSGGQIAADALTKDEENLHTTLAEAKSTYERLLMDVLEGRTPQLRVTIPEAIPKRILVRFLQPIPAIIGADMKTYGPFKAEDVATLPVKNAEVFIQKGLAVAVESR